MAHENSPTSGSGGAVKHDSQTSVRAVTAACIGNIMEWYDFSMYAFYAMYIASNFFAARIRASNSSKPSWLSVWVM